MLIENLKKLVEIFKNECNSYSNDEVFILINSSDFRLYSKVIFESNEFIYNFNMSDACRIYRLSECYTYNYYSLLHSNYGEILSKYKPISYCITDTMIDDKARFIFDNNFENYLTLYDKWEE